MSNNCYVTTYDVSSAPSEGQKRPSSAGWLRAWLHASVRVVPFIKVATAQLSFSI